MRRHVILITYGEPTTPAFASHLLYSWRILLGLTRSVAPIPPWALPLIALARARLRWRLWTRERYASPLEPITRAQSEGLRAALAGLEPRADWAVHVAYEFRDPLLTAVLDGLPRDEPVDVVPMYVPDSAFTHEISRATVRSWSRRLARPRPAPVRVLPPLDEQRFAQISARHVVREMEARGIGGPEWGLVLAAHGTPLHPPRPMETGRASTERIAAGITARLAGRFGTIASGWLNHTYGGRWTEPAVEEALRRLADAGCRRVAYYPYGFYADNAETELEGRIALRAHPWLEVAHLPCLNADPELLQAFARQVLTGETAGVPRQERVAEPAAAD